MTRDAVERAHSIISKTRETWRDRGALSFEGCLIGDVAAALTAAAADARWEAIEECARKHDRWAARAQARADSYRVADNHHRAAFDQTECGVHLTSAADLRALAAQPPAPETEEG